MKIREFLTEANWGKGFTAVGRGDHCLLTALGHCYCYQSGRERAAKKIRRAIGSIIDWNDAPERTFAEVKALVERLDV